MRCLSRSYLVCVTVNVKWSEKKKKLCAKVEIKPLQNGHNTIYNTVAWMAQKKNTSTNLWWVLVVSVTISHCRFCTLFANLPLCAHSASIEVTDDPLSIVSIVWFRATKKIGRIFFLRAAFIQTRKPGDRNVVATFLPAFRAVGCQYLILIWLLKILIDWQIGRFCWVLWLLLLLLF